VPTREALGKELLFFFENFLCRVPTREALGKDFLFFLKKIFAECRPEALGKDFLFFLYVANQPLADI